MKYLCFLSTCFNGKAGMAPPFHVTMVYPLVLSTCRAPKLLVHTKWIHSILKFALLEHLIWKYFFRVCMYMSQLVFLMKYSIRHKKDTNTWRNELELVFYYILLNNVINSSSISQRQSLRVLIKVTLTHLSRQLPSDLYSKKLHQFFKQTR